MKPERLLIWLTAGALSAMIVIRAGFSEPRTAAGEPPSFITRSLGGVDTTWARTNEVTASLNFSHNLGGIFVPGLYATHPEFFPLEGTRRLKPPANSYFWNPDIAREDVARFAAAAARLHFETHPEAISFSLGINDALVWGESEELRALTRARADSVRSTLDSGLRNPKIALDLSQEPRIENQEQRDAPSWFRERPDYSNLVFTFMNRAAAELAKTHPSKYLGALAYYWAENGPSFGLHPQIVPFLTADRSQGYDPVFKREEFDLQEKWGRAIGRSDSQIFGDAAKNIPKNSDGPTLRPSGVSAGPRVRGSGGKETAGHPLPRLGVYDYLYGSGYLIPRIWTHLLAENLRHARRAGFTDYYAEGNPNRGLDGPMLWLTAQLLQDVERGEALLLDLFYRENYREAAEPMRRFFERCEELWMRQPGPAYWLKHYRNESQAIIFPSEECRVLREILNEANDRVSLSKRGGNPEGQRPEARGQKSGDDVSPAFRNSGLLEFQRAGTAAVRRNVKLVSDAFGVTERFGAFFEARDRLSRLVLNAAQNSRIPERQNSGVGRPPEFRDSGLHPTEDLPMALTKYLSARDEFVRYTMELRRSSPTAMRTFNFDDYLKNDPAPMARRILARANQEPTTKNQELLTNAAMTGPLQAARTIASLPYGVALPAPWQSSVEPAQYHSAELTGSDDARVLRISGTKDTSVSQWVRIGGPEVQGAGIPEFRGSRIPAARGDALRSVHVAQISVRGHVSPGTIVTLVFTWLNEKQQYVGYSKLRLPDGEWPEFVTLEQAALPPTGAAWAGIGLRIQNQVKGDWVEAKEFSLRTGD